MTPNKKLKRLFFDFQKEHEHVLKPYFNAISYDNEKAYERYVALYRENEKKQTKTETALDITLYTTCWLAFGLPIWAPILNKHQYSYKNLTARQRVKKDFLLFTHQPLHDTQHEILDKAYAHQERPYRQATPF